MAYSANKWAKAKSLYETGNYSIDQLHGKCTIGVDSLKKRIAKEQWKKGVLKPDIEEAARKNIIDIFAAKGIDSTSIANKIQEGFNCADDTMGKLETFIAKIKTSGMKDESFLKLMDMIRKMLTDKRLALEYVKEANKILGNYAPIKQKIEDKRTSKLTERQIIERLEILKNT